MLVLLRGGRRWIVRGAVPIQLSKVMYMKLNLSSLSHASDYEAAGIQVPAFDVAATQERARTNPRWVHIGPGNIFRIFLARIADDMLADGKYWPITGVVPMDPAEMEKQLEAFDLLTLGVILSGDKRDTRVIAGLADGLATRRDGDFDRLVSIFTKPEMTTVTLTITEKGYVIQDSQGELSEATRADIASDPYANHANTMALLAGLLAHRYQAGGAPINFISADNFSHNGDKLRDSVLQIARGWVERGALSQDFLDWVSDDTKVAFPISVIDKITPRPSEEVSEYLTGLGFTDMGIDHLGRTPIAGFVNAEPTEYLIIEDKFAAERPPFEDYGVYITDRETCDKFERMKVTTCLNPLHTALAVSGTVMRFPTIDSEMRDPDLAKMVNILAYDEAMPVVTDPGIIDPKDFVREVLEERFPNSALPDNPARIAMDTSQKIPIRFGVTLQEYQRRGLDMDKLRVIPLVFAVWARYLLGIADDGEEFAPSSDPLLEELQGHLKGIKLGDSVDAHAVLKPILSNANIFGLDLYTTPLAEKVEALFTKLIAGPGAVRATIHEEIN